VTKEITRVDFEKPQLPTRYVVDKDSGERIEKDWHPNAVAVWNSIWDSEMADEFFRVDIGTFIRLLDLETKYWERSERDERGIVTLNEQINAIIKEAGLTVMRRRVLGWVVAQTDESEARAAAVRRAPQRPLDVGDVTVPEPVLELPPGAVQEDPDDLFA